MGKMTKTLAIVAILALLVLGWMAAPAAAQSQWSVPMTASAGAEGSNANLRLGTNNSATDGFDSGIDVPHPPPAPGATFDACFSIAHPLFPELNRDYRAPADSITWTLHVESGTQPISLSWNSSAVPENVQLRLTGPGLDIDMKAASNTTLAAGAYTLTVQATTVAPPQNPVQTATGSGTATLSTSSGTMEDLVAVAENMLPADGKPNLVFPHGFFSFRITGLANGETVTVTITLPSPAPAGSQYWKYGPTPTNPATHWYQLPMGDNDGDNVITITLVDGGLGDDDLAANGVIVDQGGPGNPWGGGAVSVFPNVYVGLAAVFAVAVIAYYVRRRFLGRE